MHFSALEESEDACSGIHTHTHTHFEFGHICSLVSNQSAFMDIDMC